MGSATGWDGLDMSHPTFLLFNTTPMGVAWKESTPEGLRPPQYSEGGGAPAYYRSYARYNVNQDGLYPAKETACHWHNPLHVVYCIGTLLENVVELCPSRATQIDLYV